MQPDSHVSLHRPLSVPHQSLLVLEKHIDGLDDLEIGVRLAIDDHLMLTRLRSRDMSKMLLRQAIVPAAVPCSEIIGVFLIGVGELGASQGLNVNESLRIHIGREWDLSLGRSNRDSESAEAELGPTRK
jgi:hypothetical protein